MNNDEVQLLASDPEFSAWSKDQDSQDYEHETMDEDGFLVNMLEEYEDGFYERQGSDRF